MPQVEEREREEMAPAEEPERKGLFERNPRAKWIVGAVALVLIVVGLLFWIYERVRESTDDAQITGDVVPVAARVAAGRDGIKIVRRQNDLALSVVMRAADGPYADPRVRQAFRLAVDREAMVKQVLGGYGSVGNDVLGTADPAFARDLPQRKQDLARAGALLDEAGFDVTSPRDPERRGGTVTVRTPEFEAVHAELAEREILCDFRPDSGLRLGPHFFTTDDELRFAVEQIAEIVGSRAYERHSAATARF